MVRELADALWSELRSDGRHSVFGCPCGNHIIPVPTSHRMISPGVVRKIRQAIENCKRGA
jgi:hypothetical protein